MRCSTPPGRPVRTAGSITNGCASSRPEHLARKRAEADALFHRVGITFAVYGENEGTERLIPFESCRASCRAANGSASRRA